MATTRIYIWTWIWPRGIVDWVRKCLFDFNTGKTQLILFDRSKNSSATGVKMDGYVTFFRKTFFLRFYLIIMSRTQFQSESKLYSCMNSKEFLAWNRRDIWILIDSNGSRTHNHLVRKRTLNHLAKLANLAKCFSVCLQTKWLWVRIPLLSLLLRSLDYLSPLNWAGARTFSLFIELPPRKLESWLFL